MPTHEVLVRTETDDGKVRISLPDRDSIPNRDFVLRYRATTQQPRATLFLSNADGPGYFSLAMHPPTLDVEELVAQSRDDGAQRLFRRFLERPASAWRDL